MYSIGLDDLSRDFHAQDQPIRIFQRNVRDDAIIVVIERENNLLPSIHQEIGVITLELDHEKQHVRMTQLSSSGASGQTQNLQQGALLEFCAFEDEVVSIWHPNRNKRLSMNIINPIDTETVQIESKYGHVLRSVSPRVKPKSYRIAQNRKKSKAKKHSQAPIHARVTRQYKINHRGSHFCEISHAGRLIRTEDEMWVLIIMGKLQL